MVFRQILDFEKPVEEIERELEELSPYSGGPGDTAERIAALEEREKKLLKEIYAKLTPWQIQQVARHPSRPYTLDYIENIFDDFVELHGDRVFMDDPAIVGGLGVFSGFRVVVIGQQKGRNTKEKVLRNFGMPHPEGYRKALRLMRLAERFSLPIITLIDTPGAYPGIGAEERGQSEAIARNLMFMSGLKVPVVSIVIGEGGSGGALAIGVADRIMMFEYSTYSVISPEGCAAILWKDGSKADLAASALKLCAKELKNIGVIDRVIKEPVGGAHRNHPKAYKSLKAAVKESLNELTRIPLETLLAERYKKYRAMGIFSEPSGE